MNIYLHELKAYRKSTITWTLAITAIAIFFLMLFPTYASNAKAAKVMLEGFPPLAIKALGINLAIFFSVTGFYSFVFTYISLCGTIQAMNMGLAILSKETREKTADFLLTKPVSRGNIMTSKLLAVVTNLVITNIVFIAVATMVATMVATGDLNVKGFLMISFTLFFMQLMFVALGILISVLAAKINSVLPVSLGIVLGLFFIGAISSTLADEKIRYLTPFKYFDPRYITAHFAYETSFVLAAIIFVVAAITASYLIFSRKDIHAV